MIDINTIGWSKWSITLVWECLFQKKDSLYVAFYNSQSVPGGLPHEWLSNQIGLGMNFRFKENIGLKIDGYSMA